MKAKTAVHTITVHDYDMQFDEEVESFIAEHKKDLIDVQLSTAAYKDPDGCPVVVYTAMIMYNAYEEE